MVFPFLIPCRRQIHTHDSHTVYLYILSTGVGQLGAIMRSFSDCNGCMCLVVGVAAAVHASDKFKLGCQAPHFHLRCFGKYFRYGVYIGASVC